MAYAVLVSLFNSTHKMLNPYPLIIPCNKQTIQSLHENIHSLMSFLENTPPHKYQTTKTLEGNIRDVGYKAEDILESYISKHSRSIYKICKVDKNAETDENKIEDDNTDGDDSTDEDDSSDGDVAYEVVETEENDENDENVIMLSQSLVEVIKGFESLMEQMKEIQSNVIFGGMPVNQMSSLSVASSSSLPSPLPSDTLSAKNKFVIVDKDMMNQIKEQLASTESRLKVIPLVGMGGIGKTTLAKALIDDPFTFSHFDVRGWVTISQQYSIQDVVQNLLKDIRVDLKKKMNNNQVEDLNAEYDDPKHQSESRQQLHKTFYNRRYVVVLDDLWDTKACDELLSLFPDWNNRSRIIVTTRQSRVATFAAKSYHEMKLLNDNMSWNLLRQVVFAKEGNMNFPSELMEIGKEIAKKCSGLPLTISVIGGLLSKEKIMTVQHWEEVAENMKSALTEDGDECLEILSLSYHHLPHHLKACFLYMGIFPEDEKIDVSDVLQLWVAEGFLKPCSANKERVAEENLKDLIERNLILVGDVKKNGKPSSLKVHDLIRDLCIREARKEKLFYVWNKDTNFNLEEANGHRRLSIPPSYVEGGFDVRLSIPGKRSFICFVDFDYTSKTNFRCELLRVLYVTPDDEFDDELTAEPRNLRLFGYPHITENATWIFNMWDLQYLFLFNQISCLPQCIWFMPQLRNLRVSEAELPLLPPKTERSICVLERLEVLSIIKEFRCDDEILVRIPNLRKLKIHYIGEGKDKALDWSYYRLNNLAKMTKLENLRCRFYDISTETLLTNLAFPLSLKKLSLRYSNISWEHMDIIGVLPNLESLDLDRNAFKGQIWETSENHFEKLEYLYLDLYMDDFPCDGLQEWIVEDANHFPSLRYLYISDCGSLKEIPISIGEIPTLETIEFNRCSESFASSAMNLQNDVDLKLVMGCIIHTYKY